MLERIFYIDTRPGSPSLFAPGRDVTDYAQWLREQYRAQRVNAGGKDMYYGVAQRINQLIVSGKDGAVIHVIGPHARAAAQVIEELSNGLVQAEMLV